MNCVGDEISPVENARAAAGRLVNKLRADEAELQVAAGLDEKTLAEGTAAMRRAVEAAQGLIDALELA